MNKSSREVLTFEGGIHPSGDGKTLSSGSPIAVAPLLSKYQVVISENAGKPPKPVVKAGDLVKKYQLIAAADGFVSANLHAPTSGKVTGIVEVPGSMGIPVPAIEIEADGQDEAFCFRILPIPFMMCGPACFRFPLRGSPWTISLKSGRRIIKKKMEA